MGRNRRALPQGVAPKLVNRRVAATMLDMSLDHFERHVQPFVKTVMVGQLIQVSPAELDRWILENEHVVRPVREAHSA